jgi:hypothetical protein
MRKKETSRVNYLGGDITFESEFDVNKYMNGLEYKRRQTKHRSRTRRCKAEFYKEMKIHTILQEGRLSAY